jgi:polysaccharide export outer membrane protein
MKTRAAAMLAASTLVLMACQSGPSVAEPAPAAPEPVPPPAAAQAQPQQVAGQVAAQAEYTLDTGDKVKITVYQEPTLSGEFEVDGQGDISMSLIGEVKAKGFTLRELQRNIEQKYKDGQILRDPKVSAEAMNLRPFYIRGEVKTAGEYPYVTGLTVYNAIARAGDFTYRADRRKVFITSKGSTTARAVPLTPDLMVQPGDTIEIKDRLF